VPGTQAVHSLDIRVQRHDLWPFASGVRATVPGTRMFPVPRRTRWLAETGFRVAPGEGGLFTLAPEDLVITPEVING